MKTPFRLPARGWSVRWRGWCLGLAAVGLLGGVLWWVEASEDRLGPVLSPERQRQEALVFLRLAVKEIASRDRDNELQAIAETQAGAGDVPAAVETVKVIVEPFWRVLAWVEIAKAQRRAGDQPGGQQSLMLALKDANDTATDPGEQNEVLPEVAEMQADAGMIAEASQTAQSITDPSYRIIAWSAVAMAQVKEGNLADCRLSVARAVEAAREISSDPTPKGVSARVTAWRNVATLQAETGDAAGRDASFALVVEAVLAIKETNGDDTADRDALILSLIGIAGEQFRENDTAGRDRTFALAQAQAHQIPERWERARDITMIALEQASLGDMAGAAALKEIGEETERENVLTNLAGFQAKQVGLREALATVRTIKSAEHQADGFLLVASAREDTGDVAGQREALTLALQAVQETTDVDARTRLLGRVALSQANAGDPTGAIRTLGGRWMWTYEYLDAWEAVALAQARAGDIAGARRIARRLRPRVMPWWDHWWGRFLEAVGHPRSTAEDDFRDRALDNWSETMCAIAAAQARTGDRQGAIATVRGLPRERSGNSLYRRVSLDLLKYPVKPAKP